MLVLKRVPTLKNVDGTIIDETIMEKLKSMVDVAPTTTGKWIIIINNNNKYIKYELYNFSWSLKYIVRRNSVNTIRLT